MHRTDHFREIASRLVFCVVAGVLLAGCMTTIDSPLSPRGPQRRIYLGPSLALGINSPGGEFHSQSAQPDCGGFTGGSDVGPAFGLTFDYWFQQRLTSNGIVARIFYDQMPSTFTANYGTVPVLINNTVQNVTETHIADVTYSLIDLRLAYLYSIPQTMLGIEVGPSIGMVTTLHVNQHLHLVEPGVSFGNGSSDSTVYDQDPSNKNGIRFGLWAGLQYKFDVGWWIICPYVGYDIGLTKVLSTTSWSMSTILAGVDFKYGIK